MKVTGGNSHSIQRKQSKNESGHLVAAARRSRVRGKTLLADECKQCTKLAIHTFTNQMLPLGLLFRMNLLSNMQTNATDAPKGFRGVTFWESLRNQLY